MAGLKTQCNDADVAAFLASIEDERRRIDCEALLPWMEKVTGESPKMWGDSIVGFGQYHYVYDTGREGDWMLTGFSPRKSALTIYVMAGFNSRPDLMEKLGTYKTGVSCLYVKKLDDINLDVLAELIAYSNKVITERYSKE